MPMECKIFLFMVYINLTLLTTNRNALLTGLGRQEGLLAGQIKIQTGLEELRVDARNRRQKEVIVELGKTHPLLGQ